MKKILSMGLAVTMAMAALPTAFAADYTAGTQVEYVAADQTAYTITVPALLNPGQSGDVTLSGTWASDCTVKVTADATVELTNSINSNDKKVLDIGFAGIEKAGDNTEAKSYTEAVSVAAMPSDALFGTWSGKFNYNVEFDDGIERISFTVNGETYQGYPGMTWMNFCNNITCNPNNTFLLQASQGFKTQHVASGLYVAKDGVFVEYTNEIIDGFAYELKALT